MPNALFSPKQTEWKKAHRHPTNKTEKKLQTFPICSYEMRAINVQRIWLECFENRQSTEYIHIHCSMQMPYDSMSTLCFIVLAQVFAVIQLILWRWSGKWTNKVHSKYELMKLIRFLVNVLSNFRCYGMKMICIRKSLKRFSVPCCQLLHLRFSQSVLSISTKCAKVCENFLLIKYAQITSFN